MGYHRKDNLSFLFRYYPSSCSFCQIRVLIQSQAGLNRFEHGWWGMFADVREGSCSGPQFVGSMNLVRFSVRVLVQSIQFFCEVREGSHNCGQSVHGL